MSDGPYRDLGGGFARLTGAEAPRRAPSPITCVEDALYEMLRNSRDSGATSIFVASRLSYRRYRTLTVIDNGSGFPPAFASSIFDPGVTTRYLTPTRHDPEERPHGAGLSLHHIKASAVEAHAPSNANPTSIQATFDTRILPEKTHQTRNAPTPGRISTSNSNLAATTLDFSTRNPDIAIHHGNPAAILATLIKNHIIPTSGSKVTGGTTLGRGSLVGEGRRVGIEVSSKTAGRILSGEVRALERICGPGAGGVSGGSLKEERGNSDGIVFKVGDHEQEEIAAILRRAAAASYLELQRVEFKSVPGGIRISARVEEPEDEYG